MPSALVEETDETVGTTVSIISALFAPRELAAPGVGRVLSALFPAASVIVPLFRANAAVFT